MTPGMLRAARWYAERGYMVFPLVPNTKRPATAHGFKDASTNLNTIDTWWETNPRYNIGVRTGQDSGITVLDVDDEQALLLLEEESECLPDTWSVGTPSGGLHFWFKHLDGITNSSGSLPRGIDVRGDGGYVVAPPSVIDGRKYVWSARGEIARMPDWLAGLIRDPNGGTRGQELPEEIIEGGRDIWMTSLAGAARAKGACEQGIYALLRVENSLRCNPPMEDRELRRIAKSVSRYEPEKTVKVGAVKLGTGEMAYFTPGAYGTVRH